MVRASQEEESVPLTPHKRRGAGKRGDVWTARLTNYVKSWVERRHEEVDFYFTHTSVDIGNFERTFTRWQMLYYRIVFIVRGSAAMPITSL